MNTCKCWNVDFDRFSSPARQVLYRRQVCYAGKSVQPYSSGPPFLRCCHILHCISWPKVQSPDVLCVSLDSWRQKKTLSRCNVTPPPICHSLLWGKGYFLWTLMLLSMFFPFNFFVSLFLLLLLFFFFSQVCLSQSGYKKGEIFAVMKECQQRTKKERQTCMKNEASSFFSRSKLGCAGRNST